MNEQSFIFSSKKFDLVLRYLYSNRFSEKSQRLKCSISKFFLVGESNGKEVSVLVKKQKNPSKKAVSAASVKGNAGPGNEPNGGGRAKK